MHWKLKASIQNAIAILPSPVSYALYYRIQRHFGGLRRMNPVCGLTDGRDAWKKLKKIGCDPAGKVFFEVGTGRVPMVPLAYWLLGAKSTITVDINPYLKAELVRECLRFISNNDVEIKEIFGSLLNKERFDSLLRLQRQTNFRMDSFLDLCNIKYIAPGNAAQTGLNPQSVDVHTSCYVLQHIPPEVVKRIIVEGNRIISADGIFIHRIDYGDMFSYSDAKISPINFLQYSDAQWDKYAGNRYMYMNRLRHDDFMSLYQSAGHRILAVERTVHRQSLELLRSGGLKLDARFENKSEEILATTASWIVSKRRSAP